MSKPTPIPKIICKEVETKKLNAVDITLYTQHITLPPTGHIEWDSGWRCQGRRICKVTYLNREQMNRDNWIRSVQELSENGELESQEYLVSEVMEAEVDKVENQTTLSILSHHCAKPDEVIAHLDSFIEFEPVAVCTVYQKSMRHLNDDICCTMSVTVFEDGEYYSHGSLKSSKKEMVSKWFHVLQNQIGIQQGVPSIIKYLKKRFPQCISELYTPSVAVTSKSEEIKIRDDITLDNMDQYSEEEILSSKLFRDTMYMRLWNFDLTESNQ